MSEAKDIIKQGEVVLKTGLLKQKHKRWCELGKAKGGKCFTLEFYENSEQKDKVKNAFELFQVKTIDKVIKESSKDYYIDVHLKKDKFSLIFSGQSETESWYNFLQENSLFCDGREDSTNLEDDLTLKDNILYDSQPDENARFDVTLKPNEDTERLCLKSKYRLHVSNVCLMLEDLNTQTPKYRWYYEHLRKYGKQGPNFTIVAGRRSSSGEGMFIFIHDDPAKIVKAIDSLTKRKHNEQLTNKLNFKETNSDNRAENRKSEPILTPNSSPIPPKKSGSLKDDSNSKEALTRQNSAHLSPNFKHELEETVLKGKPIEKAKSKKDKHESKDDKKKGFTLFNKKEKKQKDSKNGQDNKEQKEERLYDEPEAPIHAPPTEPIYEEADQNIGQTRSLVTNKQSVEPSLYAQANTDRTSAWRRHGLQDEEHMENYDSIKAAASQKGKQKIPNRIDSDDSDDTYDHAFLNLKNVQKRKSDPSTNIYGTASGKEVSIPEADYELDDEEPVAYYDAVSAKTLGQTQTQLPSQEYEEVDIQH